MIIDHWVATEWQKQSLFCILQEFKTVSYRKPQKPLGDLGTYVFFCNFNRGS